MTLCNPKFCLHNNCKSQHCRKQSLPTQTSPPVHINRWYVCLRLRVCLCMCKGRPDNRRLCLILEESEVTANPQTWGAYEAGHLIHTWRMQVQVFKKNRKYNNNNNDIFNLIIVFSLQNRCLCVILPVMFMWLGRFLEFRNQVRGVTDSARSKKKKNKKTLWSKKAKTYKEKLLLK